MNLIHRSIAAGPRFALNGLAVSVMLAFGSSAYALPTGGAVSAGSANIASGAGNMTINQSSQNVAINWQSFSIGRTEAVQFVQPNSSSVALNRVLGSDGSSIMGSLSANGKVFLVNPNGILFGKDAQVNVGGLVASTRNITDSDFMAGNYKFAGSGGGTIVNQGSISADGGYVALLGANVSNEGLISARLGTVALAAGSAMTLDVAGDGLLNIMVNQGAVNALVQNGGMIRADGGQVLLTAVAAGNLVQSAVNNTGVIQAQTVENRNGTIRLMGDMQSGTVNVSGTLDASAPNGGNGGFIETSAAHVKIANDVKITTAAPMGGVTGTWLIDPADFFIAPLGGDISGATLSAQLVVNSVTISTVAGAGPGNGDIFVNDAVSWNGAAAAGASTTLSLFGLRDVNVNQAITAVSGNLVVCCGRDVNVNAAITTTRGSVLLSAGRDVNVVRSIVNPGSAITTTDGNIQLCAGRDVILSNTLNPGLAPLITLTRGSFIPAEALTGLGVPLGLTLSADTDGTGPGVTGGTVVFTNGGLAGTFITVTGPNAPVNIFYNPVNYATPTDFAPDFTGTGGPVTSRMLVFPDGATKTFDGTTTATFTGLKSTAISGIPAGVTLVGAGAANFDTAAVGLNKPITFTGFALAGAGAANCAFATTCCGPIVGRTTGNITPAVIVVPPIIVVPPGVVPPVIAGTTAGELPLLPVFYAPAFYSYTVLAGVNLDVQGIRMPPIELAQTPPPPTPVVAPFVAPPVPPAPVVVPLAPRRTRH
jgi:filamentous hemagglutinin family protein